MKAATTNFEAWAGVDAEAAPGVKVRDQAEVAAGVGSLNKSTILLINDTEGR